MTMYSTKEVKRIFGLSVADVQKLKDRGLMPEGGQWPELFNVRAGGGWGGGRQWSAQGLFRLYLILYLQKMGLTRRPIYQVISMLFEGVSSTDGPLPRNVEEYERLLNQRFVEDPAGGRKYLIINLGYLSRVGDEREFVATAEVETTRENDTPPDRTGELVLPVRQIIAEIRDLLRRAGMSAIDFKLGEGN